MQLPTTVKPPHRLSLELGVIIFTSYASHIYDLSLPSHSGNSHFNGRIEQKSDAARSWGSPPLAVASRSDSPKAVTYIDCQPCMPEYFDDWQQATLFLVKLEEIR